MRRQFRRSKKQLLSPATWRLRLVFWGGAILVGLVSALFAEATDHAISLFGNILAQSPYLPLVVTPAGLMLVAWMTRRFFRGSEGSGIPQVIAVLEGGRGKVLERELHRLMSLRVAVGKILMTLVGLVFGASIGREGPTVHIGAALMADLGKRASFSSGQLLSRGLILAGSAAGIAAAFNTPLGGIVFAVEEMSRSFDRRVSVLVLTAVIFGGTTALAILGNYTYFGVTSVALDLPSFWIVVPVCGIMAGFLGGLFSSSLIVSSSWIAFRFRVHPVLLAGLCGFVLAVLGLVSDGAVYGTGYEVAENAILGGEVSGSYPLLKAAATLVSYLSGIPGGIFAPTLSVGAVLGAELAKFLGDLPGQAIVLLTMGAYFAGVVQTPITSAVIVMEMTKDQELFLPMIAATLLASGISRLVCRRPIYAALAKSFIKTVAQTGKPSRRQPRAVEAAGTKES
jgi:H+/Cl- antiporter ClcA